jgi:hypothetical protein
MRLYTNHISSEWHPWWNNFYDYLEKVRISGSVVLFRSTIENALLQHNAILLNETPDFGGWVFEFETEEDATAFVLRWS